MRRGPLALSPSLGPLECQEQIPAPVQDAHRSVQPPRNPGQGSPGFDDPSRKTGQGPRVERTFGVRQAPSLPFSVGVTLGRSLTSLRFSLLICNIRIILPISQGLLRELDEIDK